MENTEKGQIGSSFEAFLDDQSIREEVEDCAVRELIAEPADLHVNFFFFSSCPGLSRVSTSIHREAARYGSSDQVRG